MKALILMDFIREEHFALKDGKAVLNLFNTPNGKTLKTLLEKVAHLHRNKTTKDYDVDFVYKDVPTPIRNDYGKIIKYQDVKQSEVTPHYDRLKASIVENKYDIIIPLGKLGTKFLLNNASISKMRGVPAKVTVESNGSAHDTWVLPTFSIEYTNVNKNAERHVLADLTTVGKFIQGGEEVFIPQQVEYELVTTIERVREIYQKEVKNDNSDGYDVTAWDLETNALKADRAGSKTNVISLSWAKGQGVTIPLYKSDFKWTNGQKDIDEILSLHREWLASKTDNKVGHNLQFDIRFLMSTEGFTDFENQRDTKVGWYLAVTQEQAESLRLTDLAYEATDMGGYDKPLEDFKKWYAEQYLKYLGTIVAEKIKANKMNAKKGNPLIPEDALEEDIDYSVEVMTSEHFTQLSEHARAYVVDTGLSLINKYKKAGEVINEVDGSNFNYDWIPLELMHPYASGDTDCCRRIYCEVVDKLKSQDRPRAFNLLNKDYPRLTRALARVESNGMHCDVDYMKDNNDAYNDRMSELTEEMRKHWAVKEFEDYQYDLYMMGVEEFSKPVKERDKDIVQYRTKFKDDKWQMNPGSGAHKGKILYDIMGIELPDDKNYIKETPFNAGKRGNDLTWEDYKTDKEAIAYALGQDVPDNMKDLLTLFKEYSALETKRNSFTNKLPQIMNPDTHNLHGKFNISGTATGRLSSSQP